MKTGISTASLFLRQSTEDAAVTIKNMGAACAEVFLQTFYEYRPEFSKVLAPKLQGLEVNSVHALAGNFESQLFSPSRRQRGDGFYWLDQLMRSAQLLNCKKYTFHGMVNAKDLIFRDFGAVAAVIGEASAFCARYGVRLCLENVVWSTYNRPGVFREIKRRCPELSGVFDIKQARRSGYPWQMYVNEMSGAISHVHLSDVDEEGKICLPGRGVYDFAEIISRLKDAGFDGNVIIEVYQDNYGDPEELKQSLDYLDEIIYRVM